MTGRLVMSALVMAVLVIAVLVAGCSPTRPDGPQERLRLAVERLDQAGGAAVRLETTYHNGPTPVSIVSTGVIDIAHRRYEVTTRLPRTGTVRRVYADGLAYEWRPVTGWTMTDVDAAVRGSTAFGLGHLASNPVLLLDLLRTAQQPGQGASQRAEGPADGEDGLIRAEADVSRLPETHPVWSALAGQLRSASTNGTASGRTVPLEVGTDDEGRANLLRVTLPLPEEGTAQGARPEVDVTVRISRYGTAADVAPPPPEKVRDITAQIAPPGD